MRTRDDIEADIDELSRNIQQYERSIEYCESEIRDLCDELDSLGD